MVYSKVLGAGLCLLAVTILAAPPARIGINTAGKRPAQDHDSILPKRPKSEAFTEAIKANEEEYMLLDEPQSSFVDPAELRTHGWAVNTEQSKDSLDIDSLVAGLHGLGVSTTRDQYTEKQVVHKESAQSKADPVALDGPNADHPYASYTQWLDIQQGAMIVDATDLGQGHPSTAHQASTQPLQDHTLQLWEWHDVAYLVWAEACAQHRRHASAMSWLIFINVKSASTLMILQDIFGPHLENLLSGPGMQFSATEEGGEALLGSEIGLLARHFLSSHRQEFGRSNIESVDIFSADSQVVNVRLPVMAFSITKTGSPELGVDLRLGFATDKAANVMTSGVQSGWGSSRYSLEKTINRNGKTWLATEAKYRVYLNRRDEVVVTTLMVSPEQAAALKPNLDKSSPQGTAPTISQWSDFTHQLWRISVQPPSQPWKPTWLFFPLIFDGETLQRLQYDRNSQPIAFPGNTFDGSSEDGRSLLNTPLGRQALHLISNMQNAHDSAKGSIDVIHVYSIRRNWAASSRLATGNVIKMSTRPCVAMHVKWE
ncbi:hypothetical protein LTR78_007250 [Recurvomyces mirabilis]|uniref:Uncharacterized protein n=1 Tax=Recurvomyces mirabilis TaxID=574656 RepID=A0AAE0WJK0_9PEZI|nr:hypothetical protein LTR78_007250 [Recurvomyces mirabilis]KAK5155507.1 hypothetical protein LTS14_005768 [Recurvomyces mirabilis]